MRRKIQQVDIVDTSTGEIVSSQSTWVNKSSESFVMLRTTNGIDWYFPLTRNEKNLFLMLSQWADSKTMKISISKWQRIEIYSKLEVERRMVSLMLRGLEDKNCIKRISQNDFMINPSFAFKCSTNELKLKINDYNKLKQHEKGIYRDR